MADLAAEWAGAIEVGKGAEALPGFDGTITVVVSGTPVGDVTIRAEIAGGRLVSVVAGDTGKAPGVQFAVSAEEGRAVLAGALDPSVAFMRGRLKTAGSPGLVLEVLAAAATDEFDQWRRQILSATEGLDGGNHPAPPATP